MFDRIHNSFDVIRAYCDQASDENWTDIVQRIKTECEDAKLDLEELEFQHGNADLKMFTMKKEIPYFVEYTDSEGITHYAVHFYNRLTGFVTMMKDHQFDKA